MTKPLTVELDLDALVGHSLREVESFLVKQGYFARIMRRNGEDVTSSAEHNPERVNISVTNNIVDEVFNIG